MGAVTSNCLDKIEGNSATVAQSDRVGNEARRGIASLDFAVAGLGTPEGLPNKILDLRFSEVTVERALCDRYAQSHVVVGVHGSHMLLPSAHAGAVIELMPEER